MVNAGIPTWLLAGYPRLHAVGWDDKPRPAWVSYTHPLFLEKARRWYEAVIPLLARHGVERGGPVTLAQVDNEATGIHLWFGGQDHNPETFGLGREEGVYASFLRRRRGTLEAVNQSYGTQWANWSQAHPCRGPGEGPEAVRRRRDWFECYLAEVARYLRTLADWMGELGLRTPVIHNSANWDMNLLFTETVAAMPPGFLLGSDHYYNLDQHWRQNNPTPQWFVQCLLSLQELRGLGFPPTIFELPAGSASAWPPIGPTDAGAAYWSNLAAGMKGHNYYIFTGGPNPPGAGTTSDIYDYTAGVAADGALRPLYAVQKRFGRAIRSRPWLAEAEAETDHRLVADQEWARWKNYGTGFPGLDFDGTKARNLLREGLLTSGLCAGLSAAVVEAGGAWSEDTTSPAVVVCASAMARATQQRVVDFLQRGGRALVLPLAPSLDEDYRPCSVLADFLGGRAGPFKPARSRVSSPTVANVSVNGPLWSWSRLPADSRILLADEWSGATLAWWRDLPGGGRVVVSGFSWYHRPAEPEPMCWLIIMIALYHQQSGESNNSGK